MLSFLRGRSVPRTTTAHQNPVYYENDTSWQYFFGPEEQSKDGYMVTHHIPHNASFFNPPLHLHLFQTEQFRVRKGSAIFRLPHNRDPTKRTVVVRASDENPEITIPVGAYHHFASASSPPSDASSNSDDVEHLEVDIRLDVRSPGGQSEEKFFRNFMGYLEDCNKAKSAPSIFQLNRFLYKQEIPLAVPLPVWFPQMIKYYVSWLVLFLVGNIIAGWILGYQGSYSEYYNGGAKPSDDDFDKDL